MSIVLDPSIRKTVLSCLEPSLDHHLAQVENLRSLCIALNDSVVEVGSIPNIFKMLNLTNRFPFPPPSPQDSLTGDPYNRETRISQSRLCHAGPEESSAPASDGVG